MAKLYEHIPSGEIGDSSRPSVLEVELEIGDSGPPPVEHVLSAVKAVVTNNRGDDVTQGLIGYWAFDDSVGLVAIDYSGNDNNGALEGTTPTWVTGISGQAINFPGTDERVDCGNPAPLSGIGNGDFSLSLWMKSKDTVPLNYGGIFEKIGGGSDYILIDSNGISNQIRVYLRKGAFIATANFNAAPFDTSWHHLVLVVNRTTDKALIYLDSVKDDIEIDVSGLPANISNVYNTVWGGREDGTYVFEGRLDECRIYNRVLTEGEIEFLHAVPSGITSVNAYPVRAIGGDILVETDGFGFKFPDGSRQTIAGDSRISSIAALDQTGDPKTPDGTELFEFNTPDVVSSLGRTPIGNPIYNYFPAKITEQGIDSYDSPWRKWNNRSVIGVFQGANNLVKDPEDLTSANWGLTNATVALTDQYFNGKRFTAITGTSAAGQVWQSLVFTVDATKSFSCVLKKGTFETDLQLLIRVGAAGAVRLAITLNWSTKVFTEGTGSIVEANWYGDDIVEVFMVAPSIVAAEDNRYSIRPSLGSTGTVLATAMQAEDSAYPTPYTPTSRAAGQLDYPLTMPSQFTTMFWVRPWFAFDTGGAPFFLTWHVSDAQRFIIYYDGTPDAITAYWKDGGTLRTLESQAFTAETIAAWIHVAAKIDLTTGDATGSALWINGVEKDTSWDGNIDTKTTSFNKLSIGYFPPNTLQADALITDFLFADSLLADSVIAAHYIADRPFYADNRLLGKNCEFRIDEFGNAYFKNTVIR